jgi:hypothetical protein
VDFDVQLHSHITAALCLQASGLGGVVRPAESGTWREFALSKSANLVESNDFSSDMRERGQIAPTYRKTGFIRRGNPRIEEMH